jgi:hypothetical protein
VPERVVTALANALNQDAAFKQLFPNQTISDTEQGVCVSTPGMTAAVVDAKLPHLKLTVPASSGGTFAIDLPASQSYLFDDGDGSFCLALTSSGTNPSVDGSTIGDTLLAGMLTVIDVEHRQVGFAPQRGCGASARTVSRSASHFRPAAQRHRPAAW